MRVAAVLLVSAVVAAVGWSENLDLLDKPDRWLVNTDRGGTKISLRRSREAPLVIELVLDGEGEDYPKARLFWREPQDFSSYLRLNVRLRVTCDDPSVHQRHLAFVFYDAKTLRQDLPSHPMTQQTISHYVPVGRWVHLSDWLVNIHRSAIRQLDIYLYEQPASRPTKVRWEFARLELEEVSGGVAIFDTRIYERADLRAEAGKPIARVKTTDGLVLVLGTGGGVTRVTLEGRTVGQAQGQLTGLFVRDAATQDAPRVVGGKVEQHGDEVRQSARLDKLGLEVEATYRSAGPYLEVVGKIRDLWDRDRAVTVGLGLPLDRKGRWRWWDSVAHWREAAEDGAELAYYERNCGYGERGTHSKYPMGAVTWPGRAGLTLALRMDEPRVHRIAYNPGLHLLYMVMDFGLIPEKNIKGRSLAEAVFRFLIYRHDPAWGFRSALQRYYDFFPDFFVKRVKHEGGWYGRGKMQETKGALEAGFRFHWGPGGSEAVKWDNAHGVLALQYIEPEMFQLTMGDYEQAPTRQETLERLHKLAQGDGEEMAKFEKLRYASSYAPGLWVREHSLKEMIQTVARAAESSAVCGMDGRPCPGIGRFPWIGDTGWGAIFRCNLDPDIPHGKGWFCREVYLETGLRQMKQAGAQYDGIGLDSFGGYGVARMVDYKREHFRYADIPLSFSAADHRPVQVCSFATVEWLRDLAERMHRRGLVLMANCSWGETPGWLTFAAPYLDIFGAEAPVFADADFIRAVAYHKPCTNLPYKPRPLPEVRRQLLHAVFLGHGSELAVMKKYWPVLRALAKAGWEPITLARATPDTVRVERFGRGHQLYLVLHNPMEKTAKVRVTVDVKAFGLGNFSAADALSGKALLVAQNGFATEIDGGDTRVVTLKGK